MNTKPGADTDAVTDPNVPVDAEEEARLVVDGANADVDADTDDETETDPAVLAHDNSAGEDDEAAEPGLGTDAPEDLDVSDSAEDSLLFEDELDVVDGEPTSAGGPVDAETVGAEPTPAATDREGYLDPIEEGGWAAGWARWLAGGPKLSLDVFIDGQLVETILADQYREDLQIQYNEPNIAYWFGIPEALLDGDDHEIDVRYADTGQSLPGSPRSFSIATLRTGNPSSSFNLIANADFLRWPGGLSVTPKKRFEEVAEGWYFDARKGTSPDIRFRAERPADLALGDDAYALNVNVRSGGNDGFMRLIVPIDPTLSALPLFLSMGIRRPVHAAGDALYITELFLADARDGVVEKIHTLRRNLRPRGTQRLQSFPLGRKMSELAPSVVPAIVVDFRGDGELTLFSPELSALPIRDKGLSDAPGEFEDPAIRSQVPTLKLSPIWTTGEGLSALRAPGQPPELLASADPLPAAAETPFIQIVVPVFNAGLDVEELLRSILSATDTPFEILLFDDGSGAFTAARVEAWTAVDRRIRYHRHRANVGYTGNVNIGLQSSETDFVVLLNSDTIVTPGWLAKLYQVVSSDDRIAAAGPVSNAASWQSVPYTKSAVGEWIVNALGDDYPAERINAMVESASEGIHPAFPLLNGFCTLFRRSALETIGYFDDAAFPRGYGEENDLCLRLSKAGFELRVATDTYVHHKKSRSFGHGQRKTLSKNANAILRNRYPEVDFGKLEEAMRTEPAINALRQRLLALLAVEPAI